MGPEYGVDAAGKFFLGATATLVGAILRVPYTFAVARFGGRNWTVVSALLLLIPTIAAAFVLQPGTAYTAPRTGCSAPLPGSTPWRAGWTTCGR